MRFVKYAVVVFAVVTGLLATGPAQAQAKANKYQEARDLIRRARTLLGDFVNENPKSDDAHFARIQLAALENIFKTDVPVVPVPLNDPVTWRIVRVENRDSDTKVTLEIENPSESAERQFASFNNHPLVLIANKKVYAMKKGDVRLPAGAQVYYDSWKLQPMSAINVELYFDALDEGVLEGMVKYAGDNQQEKPARFSLMSVKQSPSPE